MLDLSTIPVWMVWNTMLAVIPLGLSFVLFGQRRRPTPGWWAGLAAFLFMLPNAPYVLTDVIHLIDQAQHGVLIRTVVLYVGFISVGAVAYTVCVSRFVGHLRRWGGSVSTLIGVEGALHGIVAVGVLIGRYGRWNTWDLGTRPVAVVQDSAAWLSPRALVAVVLLAGGLAVMSTTLRLAARGAANVLTPAPAS